MDGWSTSDGTDRPLAGTPRRGQRPLRAEQDLLVSVRGGGHNYAGKSVCEGLMIDLPP